MLRVKVVCINVEIVGFWFKTRVTPLVEEYYKLLKLNLERVYCMARLTRDKLFSIKLKEKEVLIPELDGEVLMRELTVAQQDKIRESCTKGFDKEGKPIVDLGGFRRKLVMETIVDPILQPEDFEALEQMPGGIFNSLQNAAIEVNGLQKDLKDEVKN